MSEPGSARGVVPRRIARRGAPGRAASRGFAALAQVALLGLASAAHADSGGPGTPTARTAYFPRGVLLRPADGDTRLVLQPGGPFAAVIFRDGIRGEHVGVTYLGTMRFARLGAWQLDDRFWQEPAWSADVNALVWSPGGDALYVSTGNRGSGAVYRLDLAQRIARQVWPDASTESAAQGAGRSCEILYADPVHRLLHVRYQAAAERGPIAVQLRLE